VKAIKKVISACTKRSTMVFKEKTLRKLRYGVVAFIFFVFLMQEILSSWSDFSLLPKVLAITVFHFFLLWESTRYVMLQVRKKSVGLDLVQKRLTYVVLILVPYSLIIGFLRLYLEDTALMWNSSAPHYTTYVYTAGISLLFISLQVALYESIYFFAQWRLLTVEAEDLRKVNLQIQTERLRGQIQPHFLFNTLNTLIGLIEADRARAVLFTENLASVYRYLLHANEMTYVNLEEELKFTRLYFFLLKTRYPDGLFLEECIREGRAFILPALSLQVLIENAVKHNMFSSAKPLRIQIEVHSERHILAVTNNLQAKPVTHPSGKGLNYLQEHFSLLDLPPVAFTKGETCFTVYIPLIKKYQNERADH
jgi:sensor histidine kinase YesM